MIHSIIVASPRKPKEDNKGPTTSRPAHSNVGKVTI